MPETLYNSVKASVVEYEQIKKHNERAEDKQLFRWKLVTIFLGIVFILLIGLFSQFLKSLNNIPEEQQDYSYILPLLGTVSESSAGNLEDIANIVAGVAVGAKESNVYLEYNAAQKIFSAVDGLIVKDLVETIKGHEHLLFLFNTVYNETETKFGMYAHKGYTQATQAQNGSNTETVRIDSEGTQFSTIFNINNGIVFLYQISVCNLFSLFEDNQKTTLRLFSMLDIDSSGINVDAFQFVCMADKHGKEGDLQTARQRVIELTGIGWEGLPQKLNSFGLEVYKLYLNQEK